VRYLSKTSSIFKRCVKYCIIWHLLLMVYLQTCKELHKILESRNVWQQALRDILSVIPLPALQQKIPQLTTKEIKMKTIIAARLAHIWSQKTVKPRMSRKFECDCDVACLRLLPGGKWLVVAQCDGSLGLYDISSGAPELAIADLTLCDEDWHIDSFSVDLRLSVSNTGEILVVLATNSTEYSHHGEEYVECPLQF